MSNDYRISKKEKYLRKRIKNLKSFLRGLHKHPNEVLKKRASAELLAAEKELANLIYEDKKNEKNS